MQFQKPYSCVRSPLSLVEVKVQTSAGDLFFLFCTDRTELQKAMEHSNKLDKEILALRARVQTLDLERKAFLDLVSTHLLLLDLLVGHGTNEPLHGQHCWAVS